MDETYTTLLAELREQKALLERAQEVGGVGSWVWYPRENRNTWSPQARRIYGFTDEDADREDPSLFFTGVHPADRDALQRSAWEAFKTGKPVAIEYRFIRPVDGQVRWLRGQSIVDGDRVLGAVTDVTDEKLAQETMLIQTALLERAQDIGGVGSWAWYAAEDRNVWSGQAARILGYTADEAGRDDHTLFFEAIHPDDRVIRNEQTFLEAVIPKTIEYRIVRRTDGEVRWLRETGVMEPGADGRPYRLVGALRDVTEERAVLEELQRANSALERAHEIAKLSRFSVELPSGRITYSPEFASLIGESLSTLPQSIADMKGKRVHPDDRERWLEAVHGGVREGGETTVEVRLIRPDGEIVWVRMHARVEFSPQGDRATRVVGVVQDVTDRHELEQRLLQAQKLEAVGQLAGGVAHDFNNLLTVIVGNAEFALAHIGEEARDEVRGVLRAADRATELVRQLLAFSRADVASPRVVDLNAAVGDVRKMLERLIEETIRIKTTLAESELPVLIDPGQLEQVILNLAVNARDAMHAGGTLHIETHADGPDATLSVSDTGVGMDEATIARIFDPFYTTKEPGKGTGLGLSTVYGIVTRAGGGIDVESAPGIGTMFTVRLPRTESPQPDDSAQEEKLEQARHGERILIVEDDEMVRSVAAEMLDRSGYEVVVVGNGQDALETLANGETFDLIVSDLMMPVVTGAQLADALAERGVRVRTLFTSGYAHGDNVPAGSEHAFLPKPFTSAELTAAVRRLLDT